MPTQSAHTVTLPRVADNLRFSGFGNVYSARSKAEKHQYALKKMPNNSEKQCKANLLEVRAMYKCKHRNIVRFYNAYLTKSHIWVGVVMSTSHCAVLQKEDCYGASEWRNA